MYQYFEVPRTARTKPNLIGAINIKTKKQTQLKELTKINLRSIPVSVNIKQTIINIQFVISFFTMEVIIKNLNLA